MEPCPFLRHSSLSPPVRSQEKKETTTRSIASDRGDKQAHLFLRLRAVYAFASPSDGSRSAITPWLTMALQRPPTPFPANRTGKKRKKRTFSFPFSSGKKTSPSDGQFTRGSSVVVFFAFSQTACLAYADRLLCIEKWLSPRRNNHFAVYKHAP